jgi:hypothetical protein
MPKQTEKLVHASEDTVQSSSSIQLGDLLHIIPFIPGLFTDTVSSPNYSASNDRIHE